MKKIVFAGLILALVNQSSAQKREMPQKPTAAELAKIKAANIKQAAATQFQYFIIKADSTTYGYSIYANGNLYIEQKTIPAISEKKGFTDTAAAARTAQLVIQKIKQGEMPPSLTTDELKKLNVIQ